MKAEETFVYIKAFVYLVIATMFIVILYKVFRRISKFLQTKSEEATEFAQKIEAGEDYLQPGAWKKLVEGRSKVSDLVDFNKATSAAISFYVAKKTKDAKEFLKALKRLETKLEVAIASQILFNQYKLVASSIAQDLNVYEYAKKYVNSLRKY
jgi:glutaredoxin 2